jgi:predicted  nucleic acid-binding Zn-ribbon protein
MIELYSPSAGNSTPDLDSLCASIKRVAEKIQVITEATKNLNQNRVQLEGKIEDAQKRIQHILSRLPEQSDGRQLNLLGETIPPTTPEDDSEPTTH